MGNVCVGVESTSESYIKPWESKKARRRRSFRSIFRPISCVVVQYDAMGSFRAH